MHHQGPSIAQCFVSLGEQTFRIARPALGWIEALPPLRPLPWAPATLRGLVDSRDGLLPLLQPPGTQALAPLWLVVVHTALGPLGLAADAVDESPSAEALDAAPDLLAALADWAAGLQAAPTVPAVPRAQALAPNRRVAYLRVRSGPNQVVVPATQVGQVLRHDGVQPWAPRDAGLSVVRIGSAMGLAHSLAARGPSDAAPLALPISEPWCLCAATPGQPGLLVEEVLGFVEAEADQLHTLRHAGQQGRWLLTPDGPALPVLDLQEDPAASGAQALALQTPPPTGVSAPAGLRLTSGPWHLVVSAARVDSVVGYGVEADIRAQRGAGALPVLDLGRCWGLAASDPQQRPAPRLAVQLRWRRRAVLLLCEQASPALLPSQPFAPGAAAAAGNTPWPEPSALPALPQALAGLVQAVRPQGDGLAFLLCDNPAAGLRQPRVRSHLMAAGAGWYGAPETLFSS